MRSRRAGRVFAVLAGTTLFLAGPVHATPSSSCTATGPQNLVYPGNPNWSADLRGAGTASITGAQPRSGNGSLELATTASLTDWGFFERFAPAGGWGLLSQINCLTFEWYKQFIPSPTDVPWLAQTPVLRLFIQDGQQQSELVWEKYYTDGSPALTGQWISQDVFNDNLWRYVTGGGYTIAQCANVDPFFPNPLLTYSVAGWAGSGCFSSNAFVAGIGLGVGSNWPYQYRGFVDNVQLGFAGQNGLTVNDNFELAPTAVPEPSTIVLVATGLAGVLGASWIRQRKKRSVV